ncbi:MAG: DMT family transporter [Dermatophilaceae bacterium]
MVSRPHPPARQRLAATVLLVALTAVWGSTFLLIHDLVQTVPAVDLLAVRFGIAALLMLVVFWRPMRALRRRHVAAGIGLGLLYGAAQILQTQGLVTTDPAVSGFVTGTYVVLTPVLSALLLGEHVPPSTWYAVLLAAAGLALLTLNGLSVGVGEALTLLAAALYAGHIIGLGRLSTPSMASGMSAVQMIVIAAMCLLAAAPAGLVWPQGPGQWATVVYLATVAGALALWAQTWAQARMSATRAAIVMTLEPVFAAGFAVAFGDQTLGWRMLLGGALVLAAMYTVELVGRRPGELPPEALHHEV